MFFALDNTVLTPPFLPSGRASDVLFGRMLRYVHPGTYVAHLPWGLVHDPVPHRECDVEELWRHSGVELAYLIGDVLEEAPDTVDGDDAAHRVAAMGSVLIDFASQPLRSFIAIAHRHVTRRQRRRLASLEGLMTSRTDAPATWRNIASRYATELDRSLGRIDGPIDMRGGTNEEAWSRSQALTLRFGHLLQQWPHLVEGARALAMRGMLARRRGWDFE
jgi:hypothetical protein